MPKDNESTMKWKVDVSDLKAAMQDAKRSISLANAEFKTATAGMDKWQDSTTGLEAKIKQLNSTLPQQKTILSQLEEQYKIVAKEQGENSAEAQRLKIQIENQRASISKTEASISKYGTKLKELQNSEKSLTSTIGKQEQELSRLKTAYVDAVAQYGKNSKEAKALASQISSLSGELAKNKAKSAEASAAADKLDKSLDEVSDSVKETESNVGSLSEGFTVMKGMMANLAAQGVTALIGGLKNLGAALINTGKQAIMSYADYEQLVGGVETLFGTGGMNIREYAKSVGKTVEEVSGEYNNLMKAQDTVLANAGKAFQTAGLSQNQYMETVTSFSASLIGSLGGDTAKAAKVADQAIIDMSDNANKMGTSMTDIQNAYQGFAKQNYTMLDNLKLGYGGTKTEMERLIADANELKVAQGGMADLTIDSYADIIEAIHLVQDEMGITGTTQKEAATTITGSLNMTKAAWSNLLTGMADDSADFDSLINNFTESVLAFAGNILPRIQTTIVGMGKVITGLIQQLLPEILRSIPAMITESIPMLMEALGSVLDAFQESLPQIVGTFSDLLMQLGGMLPQLAEIGVQLISELAMAILQNLPMLVTIAGETITAILNALAEAIPQIIEMIPELIVQIVDAITTQLPLILDAGLALIMALVDGIISALPVLIQALPTIIQTIVQMIVQALPKILQAGMDILKAVIAGILLIIPELVKALPLIITTIINGLMEALPMLIEASIQLFMTIVEAIPVIIEALIEALPTIITTIIEAVINSIPLLLDAAIQLLMAIVHAIPTIITVLVKEIPTIVTTIISTLLKNLPLLVQGAFQLLMGIITAIPMIVVELVKEAPAIVAALIEGIMTAFDSVVEIGGSLVEGIWDGISGSFEWIKEKIKGWVGNVFDFMKKLFGINSPSKLMRDEIGKWLPAGIAEGFDEDMPSALANMKHSVNDALQDLKSDVAMQTEGMFGDVNVNGSASSGSGSKQQVVNFNQTINSPKAVDRMTLYRETNSLLFSAKVRLGNV